MASHITGAQVTLSQDELRIIGLSGPHWIRMLREREKRILDKVYGEFRNGRHEHIAALAEFACVRDQIQEIENAIRQLNKETP
jgi:transketolase C-terminal domain/subunit